MTKRRTVQRSQTKTRPKRSYADKLRSGNMMYGPTDMRSYKPGQVRFVTCPAHHGRKWNECRCSKPRTSDDGVHPV